MIVPNLYINTQKNNPTTGIIEDNWLQADIDPSVNITLKDSIKKAKDVGKVFTTYTNPFTLPASKRNNTIFKRFSSNKVYEGFDPRRKYDARIQLNGVDFKKGYIKLNVVNMQNNMPLSYSIQFFGELASVKDILSDGNLRQLNGLSNFEFPYTPEVVRLGFEEGFDVSIDVDAGIPANFRLELTNGVETAGNVLLTLDDIQYTIPVPAGGPAYVTTAIFNYMFQIPNLGWNFFKESYNGYMNAINFTNGQNGFSPDLLFDTNNVDYLTANVQIITNGNSDPTEDQVTITPNTAGKFKFPLLSHTRGFEYSDDNGFHQLQTPDQIELNEAIPLAQRLNMYDLKPAIRVEDIFQGIEDNYPIVFNKDWMFGSEDGSIPASPIKDMYLWLHNRKGYAGYLNSDGDPSLFEWERIARYNGNGPAQGEWQLVDNGYNDERPYSYIGQISKYWDGDFRVYGMAGQGDVTLDVWIMKESGGQYEDYHFQATGTGNEDEIICSFHFPQDTYPSAGQYNGQGWYIKTKLTCDTAILEITPKLNVVSHSIRYTPLIQTHLPNTFSSDSESDFTSIKTIENLNAAGLMPDYKCIDFLSDLFKLYNLVAYEQIQIDGSYKIMIESYDNFMNKGVKYDITKYIDISKSTVERISPFAIVDYTFEEPSTFLAINQAENTGDSFGNSAFNVSNFSEGLSGSNSLLFDGGTYEVKPKLEKVMYERINTRPLKRQTPIQWGWMVGDQTTNLPEPVKGKPLYMFINRKQIGGSPLSNENQFSIRWADNEVSYYANIPSNVNEDRTQTLHFNAELEEYYPEAGVNENSLFNNFHVNYIKGIYSEYSKKIKVDAFLPPLIFSKLRLNDTIIVDNTDYFIDEMDINITTSKVKFSLLRVTNIVTRIEGNNEDSEPNEDNEELWNTTEDIWSTLPQARALSSSPFAQRVIDDGGTVESEECVYDKIFTYFRSEYYERVIADGGTIESEECVNEKLIA